MSLPVTAAGRVQAALTAAGVPARVVDVPASARTAPEAAAAIGCRVDQIVKSLVFRTATGKPLLVLASGANRVDERAMGVLLGEPVVKADAMFVHEATGFAIGGVPPLGHPAPIQTIVDEDLLRCDVLWAAAGSPRSVFSITPALLLLVTRGQVSRVALAK